MSAKVHPIPEEIFDVTRGALPASRKIYVEGEQGTKVAMREIALHDKEAPKFVVYDTSGPYTDEDVALDIRQGLPKLRRDWIEARGDVEKHAGREVKPEDNGFKEWQLRGQAAIIHSPLAGESQSAQRDAVGGKKSTKHKAQSTSTPHDSASAASIIAGQVKEPYTSTAGLASSAPPQGGSGSAVAKNP